MADTYQDIITRAKKTEAELVAEILAEAAAQGLDVTNWSTDGFGTVISRVMARITTVQNTAAQALADSGSLATARGEALDVLAEDPYQAPRRSGSVARVRIQIASSTGTFTLTARQLVVRRTTDGQRWISTNTGGEVLSPSTPLTIDFDATNVGSSGNADFADPIVIENSMSGVSVAFINVLGTPIVFAGSDEETDDSLARRCATKWDAFALLQRTSRTVEYAARELVPAVRKVYVDSQNPRGNATVDINVYGDGSPIGGGDIATLQAFFDDYRSPGCASILVQNVTATPITVSATVTVSSVAADTSAKIADAVTAYINAEPIGGIVYRSKIIAAIMAVAGVVSVDIPSFVLTASGTPVSGDADISSTRVASLSSATFTLVVQP